MILIIAKTIVRNGCSPKLKNPKIIPKIAITTNRIVMPGCNNRPIASLYRRIMIRRDSFIAVPTRSFNGGTSSPSFTCGFRNIAHNAGDSVKALIAEKPIANAIVRPNC